MNTKRSRIPQVYNWVSGSSSISLHRFARNIFPLKWDLG